MSANTRAGAVIQYYISSQVDTLNRAIAATERHAPGSAGGARRDPPSAHGDPRLRAPVHRDPARGPQLEQLLTALKHTEDLERLRTHFADRFDQLGLTVAEYPKWYGALDEEVRESYRQIERVHSQTWVAALLGQVRMFAEHAKFTRDGDKPASSLMGVVSKAKIHLLDTYVKMSHATDLVAARDEMRTAARDAHHLAEAAAPGLGRSAEEVIAPVADLGHLLVQYRQAVIARNWLLRLPGADRADRLTASLADLEKEHLHQLGEQIDQATAAMIDRWQ
nr:hypothetical protein GCM10025732_00820 [Glycomyces mayteni]